MDDEARKQRLQTLTRREREVLDLLCAGKSHKAIAADLVITERTVQSHAENIYEKLGISGIPVHPRRIELGRFCAVRSDPGQRPTVGPSLEAPTAGPRRLHLRFVIFLIVIILLIIGFAIIFMPRLFQQPARVFEVEEGTGDGITVNRSLASNMRTVALLENQSHTVSFIWTGARSRYSISVRYSNDGSSDTVAIDVDGRFIGSFRSENTRKTGANPGDGWNDFLSSDTIASVDLLPGGHQVTLRVVKGDRLEIDYVRLEQVR